MTSTFEAGIYRLLAKMTSRQNARVKIGYVIADDRKRRRRRSVDSAIIQYDQGYMVMPRYYFI